MALCSVIMVTYHTGPMLFASMKTVLRQRQLTELILVDNGNPPDVLARLQQMALSDVRLKIVTGHGNIGFSKACNLGSKQAAGDFVMLLSPDCLLPPEALADLMVALTDTPDATLAGPWMVCPDGSEKQGGRSELLTPATAFNEVFGLYRFPRFKGLAIRGDMPREMHQVPAVSGACMCLRKADYIRLFGLDESFFLHVADADLCLRVHKMGGKVICVPSVQVTHMRARSPEASPHFVEWQKAKAFIRYFDKHFRSTYVPGVLMLIKLAILGRFAVKVGQATLRGLLCRSRTADPPTKRLMLLASGLSEIVESDELHGKTVLITGATSQVGLCVLRRLLAAGAAVLAISRGDPIPFYHERLRWIKGDLTDEALHLHGYLADMLVHCAPLWHLTGTIDLLADAEVKRVIAFGSTSVFVKALSKNSYEREVVEMLSQAESTISEKCTAKEMQWTILRPTVIYGVGLDLSITSLAQFIRRFRFFPVYPPAFGKRQPVHADDLALAVMQALFKESTYGKAYNVSGGEIMTYREMLERLFRLYNKPPRIVVSTALPFLLDMAGKLTRRKHINGEIARRMNDDLVFFHDDAKRDFGFSPRPFLSGGERDIEGF